MNDRDIDYHRTPQATPVCEDRWSTQTCAHLYRAVLDSLPFPVWAKDTESRLLAVNQAFASIFNAPTSQKLIGKTDFDIVPPHMAEAYRADDQEVLSKRQNKIVEEEIPDHGVCKWFETFKAPLIAPDGTLIGTVGCANEITQRKNLKRQQEEQLATLILHHNALAGITQGVIITDAEERICYANPGFENMTGYSQQEIIGRNCRFLQGPETDQDVVRRIRGALENGTQIHGEIRNYRKDGTPFWNQFSIIPICGDGGRITQFVGIQRDVTATRLANEQLLSYAKEVEDLYQNAPCGYHSVNRKGIVIRINDTELRWLGYQRDEVIGHPLQQFFSPDTVSSFQDYFGLLLAGQESASVEAEFVCKDGSHMPVLISATALRDEKGNFSVSRASVYDLRERRRAETERRQQTERLEAMSRHLVATQEDIRRRLSADLHDRTSPNLAAISINLGILASELAARNSAEIYARIEDTRALIEDTAASIREIGSELRPQLLDYAGLLPAIENHVEDFARRTGIKVSIHCSSQQLSPKHGLEPIFFRILKEALTNCAKHSAATRVEVRLKQWDNDVEMLIDDNGVGIDQHLLGSEKSAGGQGLINMREAAEFAGGTFSVDSQAGKGTHIHVRI